MHLIEDAEDRWARSGTHPTWSFARASGSCRFGAQAREKGEGCCCIWKAWAHGPLWCYCQEWLQEYPGEGIVKAHCVPQGAWHGAPTLVAFAFSMLGAGATLRQHVLAFVRVCGCRETAKLWSWMGVGSFTKRGCCGMVAGQAFLWLSSWGRFAPLECLWPCKRRRSVGPFLSLALTARK